MAPSDTGTPPGAVPAAPGAWDSGPMIAALAQLRHDILTSEALTEEDRDHLLTALADLEYAATHPEPDPGRIRGAAEALGVAADRHDPDLVEALGPDRIAALHGLLPHV